MVFRNFILFNLIWLLGTFSIHSQETFQNIDSVLQLLKRTPEDTSRVILYQKIAGHYNVVQVDSAKAFAEEGLRLAKQLKYPFGELLNLNVLGNYFERKSNYPEAMNYYQRALVIAERENLDKGFAIVLNNIAMVQTRNGQYDEALKGYFKALEYEEKLHNQNGIAQAYNNIGVVYYYTGDFDRTTEYLTKGLEIQEQLGNLDGLQNGYNNVGAIYDYQKKYDEAISSYAKALAISKQLGDLKQQASYLSNIGLSYTQKKDYQNARVHFEQSLDIRKNLKDYTGMAHSYVSFGQMYADQGMTKEANELIDKGIALSKEYGILVSLKAGLEAKSKLLAARGDFQKANEFLYEFIAVKDSIFNENKSKAMAEIETKYQTEKKEKEILSQKALITEKELEVKQKNMLVVGGFGLAMILGLLGFLIYTQQKLKNRQLQREVELKSALAKIETQNKLQEQRLRISRDLHDNIGSQLTFIISSLDNLHYGFPEMKENLSLRLSGISSFTTQTIYELRDTIWAMNKDYIAVDDLKGRINNFIIHAQSAAAEINFKFIIEEKIDPTVAFSSVVGMNSYRIIQESVNNAIKYSSASEILIEIMSLEEQFKITISDNGKGFDWNTVEMGNGLKNLKKRAKDVNGVLDISSKINEGTKVTLVVSAML